MSKSHRDNHRARVKRGDRAFLLKQRRRKKAGEIRQKQANRDQYLAQKAQSDA